MTRKASQDTKVNNLLLFTLHTRKCLIINGFRSHVGQRKLLILI